MLRSGKSEYIIIFLFSCATSITVPFKRDFVTHQLHASAFVAAMLISLNSFCTFIATPFFGSLSDKIGRKPVRHDSCLFMRKRLSFLGVLVHSVRNGCGSQNRCFGLQFLKELLD